MHATLINDFKNYLIQLGYGKGTIVSMPSHVKDFLQYHRTATIKELTITHINNYYEYLQSRPHKRTQEPLSEIFVYQNIYGLKVFFNWLETTEQIEYNPMSVIKFKQPQSNPRQPLSQSEINELFAAATTLQEIAILHIFYSCGLRKSEGEALNIGDIHFNKRLVYVREGKFKKRRVVPITIKVATALEKYYNQYRNHQNDNKSDAFFINKNGDRMSGCSYNKILKKILERTQINKPITLHHLRHSIATHLLENKLNVENVQIFLGHSTLEATQIYAKVYKHQLNKL